MPIIDLDAPLPQRSSRTTWRPPRFLVLAPLAMLVLALPGERIPPAPPKTCAWITTGAGSPAALVLIDEGTGEVLMTYNCDVPSGS
ncbi:hypothetical protein AB0M02_45040 [Actinoplanes sp. NPDC051861]|uniref:hypothetical protein n=1 Tax=Actinoplanes sp. NPDC051861 TaxID=3155170 RepID=UPI00342F98B5